MDLALGMGLGIRVGLVNLRRWLLLSLPECGLEGKRLMNVDIPYAGIVCMSKSNGTMYPVFA